MRSGQIIHVSLLVVSAALYATLKTTIPIDDPDRRLIDAIVSVGVAIWAALIFIEALRGRAQESLKERVLGAYRRLLNRPLTLVVGDIVLGTLCFGGVCLLLLFRSVDVYSVSDVEVYQADPGMSPRKLGFVKGAEPSSLRLHLGDRWLVFYSMQAADQTVVRRPAYTARLEVKPFWTDMKRVEVPELHTYDQVK
ncbi:MAG: hypothetical protein ABSH24_09240 [Bryobacteraceae bacterium]|jgi:hypothetical protein